ncbi:MAG: NAD(+) diphosphatase [Deltaproteobacteria bacterium]|nr:NAD(+) diphosphatase [Deltaproteobacteria bacterium]MBW2048435.1 NAD(+) diphosphatase [Deltaproteobacteria bacterium]MBW2110405.1 NAD(+) diphosphatase [Deltaproteobacteria bacterium]
MVFRAGFGLPAAVPENACWFMVHNDRILIREEAGHCLFPGPSDLEVLGIVPGEREFFGSLNGRPCYVAELQDGAGISEGFSFMGLRVLFSRFEEDAIRAAGMASQLVRWARNHRYCGRCGEPTERKSEERARVCPRCDLVNYPRLSPAIIVAVLKGHEILLASSTRFPSSFFSVLAGFVEPGETLEECVEREVLEEVGIRVENIRYFGSQPWPFPDSLMIGFTARYASGEIKTDRSEIVEARWFSAGELPSIPPKISIARRLIDWFSERER